MTPGAGQVTRLDEIKAFLLITAVAAPAVAVGVVSVYGFMIWISQMLIGPPSG